MLTAKQDCFKNAIIEGLSPIDAARRAYPNSKSDAALSVQAYDNLRLPKIEKAIDEHRAELRAETDYTVAQALKEYEEARTLAMRINQPAAASAATTGKARLFGLDKDAGGGERTVIIISPKQPKPVESRVVGPESEVIDADSD